MAKRRLVLFLFIFIFVSFLLYANSIKGEFVYDDYYFVPYSELRHPLSLLTVWLMPYTPNNPYTGTYRPLSVFTFALNFILFGEGTASFHITNILINALTVFLFFVLIYKLFKNLPLAIFTSVFYAFLPIHTEAVSYIKARDDMLGALFTFASWIVFLKATADKNKINYKVIMLSSVLFILGVLGKELTIFNFAIFILVFVILQKPKLNNILKIGLCYIPAISVYMIMRFVALRGLGNGFTGFYDIFYVANPLKYVDFFTRIWSAFKIVYIYIANIFVPLNLTATYHFNYFKLVANPFSSYQSLVGIAFLFLLFLLAFSKKTKNGPMGVGSIIFLISYIPISQLFFAAGDIIGEKWMYFPSAGISLIAGFFLYELFKINKPLSVAILAATLFFYTPILLNRNKVWASAYSLYRSMTEDAPESIQGHYSLGLYYQRIGQLPEAKAEALKAYEIYQKHPPVITLLGNIAFQEKQYDEAEKLYKDSLSLDQTYASTYISLASLYYAEGNYEKTKEIFQMAMDRSPGRPKPEVVIGYAASLAKLGRYQECLDALASRKYILTEDLGHPGVKLMLAVCNYKLGRVDEAKKYLTPGSDFGSIDNLKIFDSF